MRTLLDLVTIVKDLSAQFPFGTIQNETDTQDGTPVIREIYGDILTNVYKLLQETGITPTGTEDSDISQYQILDALKNLPNELNDVEQVLSLTSLVWDVPLKLSLLPNKYFFFGRASDNYVSTETYTFKGTEVTEYPFESPTGFNASDELLVIIDTSGVRAYSLTSLTATPNEIFTSLGAPLAFNNSNVLHYFEEGNLLTDTPSVSSLENTIRVFASNGTLIVSDVFIISGFVLCVVFDPTAITYGFYQFDISDLSTPSLVTVSGGSISIGTDFDPYFYTDGTSLFGTNNAGGSSTDTNIDKFTYNSDLSTLTFVSTIGFDISFEKTTNGIIKSNKLYTFKDGYLKTFDLTSGTVVLIDFYNGIIGQLFMFNGSVYFTTGECAKKWTI